jgi:hypothetical protein
MMSKTTTKRAEEFVRPKKSSLLRRSVEMADKAVYAGLIAWSIFTIGVSYKIAKTVTEGEKFAAYLRLQGYEDYDRSGEDIKGLEIVCSARGKEIDVVTPTIFNHVNGMVLAKCVTKEEKARRESERVF